MSEVQLTPEQIVEALPRYLVPEKAAATKAKGLSLHIGLNGVSGAAYAGWTGPLEACEFDANDMAAIATSQSRNSCTSRRILCGRSGAITK